MNKREEEEEYTEYKSNCWVTLLNVDNNAWLDEELSYNERERKRMYINT